MALVGLLASIGSCFFVGTAAQRATAARQVANREAVPGERQELAPVLVDPSLAARLEIEVALRVPEGVVEEVRPRAEIVGFEMPVSYEVRDETGAIVHLGAGTLEGSTILPASDSPHRDSFDPEVTCSHRSEAFVPPASGSLLITVELPERDRRGDEVEAARVLVFDQVPQTAGRWAVSGILLMVAGPLLMVGGVTVFIVGLLVASSKRRAAAPPVPPPAG
jgi:hypothetical protein